MFKELWLMVILMSMSCVHETGGASTTADHSHTSDTPLTRDNSENIGVDLGAFHFKDIYFSSQPSSEDIAKLKAQGFVHVINFRGTSEHDVAAEKQRVESLGMIYSHIPFPNGPLNKEFIDEVTASVVKYRKEGKTLIHCSSGNRVAVWVGGHFYLDHKYSKENAFIMAKEMGLDNPDSAAKLQHFLESQ